MATANIAQTKVVPVATTLKPYYDDFDESKNFQRILFRPGYAVQARELTQIQTIMQNQIERFGNHIFQNGSLVLGGAMSLDSKAIYINLQSTYANTAVIASDFKDNVITHSSGNGYVRAYVFGGVESTSTEPPVLVIKYLTGNEFDNSATIKTDVSSGANATANVTTSGHTGTATLASINDGIFFINGYFIKVPEQTVVVDKYSSRANAKIGLEYSEDIVTDVEDTTLLDPAQEASNYQAPGAARLRVNFDLAIRSLSSTDDTTFVELMRVENGVIKKQIKYPVYSVIGDTLARRTFDESGNYTVRRFNIAVDDHPTDNTKLQIVIDPGKAYVKGYEYESIAQERLDLPKARTFESVNNRDVTVNFGNYLYINDVVGGFNVSTMEIVDLHSLSYNLVTSSTHAHTKVGTARVREMKYNSAANTGDAPNFVYTLSIFDTQFSNLTSNVDAVSPSTISIYDPSSRFSSNNDAYNFATLRFTSGPAAGEKYTVSDYAGSSKTITVTPAFITTPTNASQFSLDFNIKMVDSMSDQANTRSANVSVSSKDTGTKQGNTTLTDTTFNSLAYSLPDSFIKTGLADQKFSYYGVVSVTFGATVTVTLSNGETFAGVTDSTGKSATTLDAFQVFRTNGTRLNLASVTVDNGATNPTATIANADGYTGTALVYFLINASSGSAVGQRTKSQVTGNTSVFIPTNTLSGTFATQLSSGTTTSQIYLADGQVVITNPSKVPNEKMSLFVSDVNRIQKVYDLNGAALPASGDSIVGYSDITSFFTFDNGQRDSHYDHASISLAARSTGFTGPLIAVFDYYSSTTTPGYFSVDSYPSYEDIPSYTDSNGNIISLRDAIDFRPVRTNASNTSPGYTFGGGAPTTTGIRVPKSGTSFSTDYSYFLPKKAHVTLTTDWSQPFKIIEGLSSKNPSDPRLSDNSMLLYKLSLEAYTINKSNITTQFVENKRYTMRDIGNLETRIENLEYYQSLSILEAAADRMKILDANGLERTKYGILADDFTTHGYGDVDNGDYLISIDRAVGGLQPAQNTVAMTLIESANSGIRTLGPYTTLSFTEEKLVTQNLATKFVQVQPYMISQWVGNMTMNPPQDVWVDTAKAPDSIINLGQNDALVSTSRTSNNSSEVNSRARRIRANNTLVTETNWHTRQFGAPPDTRNAGGGRNNSNRGNRRDR
jgi:hypothetical protein